jgi:hypothetical protein
MRILEDPMYCDESLEFLGPADEVDVSMLEDSVGEEPRGRPSPTDLLMCGEELMSDDDEGAYDDFDYSMEEVEICGIDMLSSCSEGEDELADVKVGVGGLGQRLGLRLGLDVSLSCDDSPLPPPVPMSRSHSQSSLGSDYRDRTCRFYTEYIERIIESLPDVAEMITNMQKSDQEYYSPTQAYVQRLQLEPQLNRWRQGAVRWFSKVGASPDGTYLSRPG